MKTKECFKCNAVKPLSEFYIHKQMADGYLNKCKDCSRKYGKEHRILNIDRLRDYDRKRGNRQGYAYIKEFRAKYPKKYKAHTMVNNAVRDGRMKKMPCEICDNEQTHGHHDDYDFPLNVRWLCVVHHHEWHGKNGEAKNAQ